MHGDDHRPAGGDAVPLGFFWKIIGDTTTLTTGDGKSFWFVPRDMALLELLYFEGGLSTASTSGIVTVQLRNVTNGNVDMLTTRLTIDVGEFTSRTAAIPAVIGPSNQIEWGDRIAVDIDVAGTGAKGLGLNLTFGEPETDD